MLETKFFNSFLVIFPSPFVSARLNISSVGLKTSYLVNSDENTLMISFKRQIQILTKLDTYHA